MNRKLFNGALSLLTAAVALLFVAPSARSVETKQDPLPSWNDGQAKQSIVAFVAKVTKEGSPDFVPVAQRIATFDNDGTLWCEKPLYVQLVFMRDRLRTLAPQHPEWKESFLSRLKDDAEAAVEDTGEATLEIFAPSHEGLTSDEFDTLVKNWLATAKHPKYHRLYTECVYQPMLEVLAYFRANGFKTFIVSGGGIEFMRPWAESVYGVPPEQVVGSSVKTEYEIRAGKPVLVRMPGIDFIDDKKGKPVGINSHIGRRPIAAFGNSDGDEQMLTWTAAGGGARLMMLVHHDDAAREFAYGPDTKIGTFSNALMAEAKKKNWSVISMKNDWKQIFAFENK
jgi:hypothetical protein